MREQLRKVALAVLGMACTTVFAKDHVLNSAELREHLTGKTISDGTHWSYALKVDGSIAAIDMGKIRTGAWRVSHGELCVRVPVKADEDCWAVRQHGQQWLLIREGGAPIEITIEAPTN